MRTIDTIAAHLRAEVLRPDLADAVLLAAARSMLASIACVMGVEAPPLAISRIVPNAAADAVGVLVNPEWLHARMRELCDDPTCHVALLLGILGHELAHLVYGDIASPLHQKHAIELRADRFAAIALARLGVGSDAFADVMWQIAEHHSNGPFGYPSRYERIEAIHSAYALETARIAHHAGQLAALRHFGLAA